MELDPRPWEALPRELAVALRPQLAPLADEIVEAIRVSVPAYARPMAGRFGEGVRTGVEEALRRFVALIDGEPVPEDPGREMYRALGRGEQRAGRTLDALQAAYRLGARVAWRRLAATGEAAGLDAPTLQRLGEAIFAYIDELAAESVEGYAEAQAARAGQRERRRRRLVALLAEGGADADEAARAARAADWPLPRELAAVALAGAGAGSGARAVADAGRVAARLGPEAVLGMVGDAPCLLLADPGGPGRERELRAALAGAAAGVGPAVSWRETARSLRWARRALALAVRRATSAGSLVRADEHLAALLLTEEEGLAAELATRRLAPLDDLPAAARERSLETLGAWLAAQGRVPEVAAALHVHPQTVRYRIRGLRERLGDALDDPSGRFELDVALRARAIESPRHLPEGDP